MNIYGTKNKLTLRDKVRVWYFCISLAGLCAIGNGILADLIIIGNLALAGLAVRKCHIEMEDDL